MELMTAIMSRRSVREYDGSKNVTDDQITKILKAAIWAPSSGNTQCWRFFVVRDQRTKERLATEAGHQDFLKVVPVVMVVAIDLTAGTKYGVRAVELYSIQDTAAAIQNMLLTMTEMGLASCWIGSFDEKKAHEILELPKELRTIAMLPVGYPAETPSPPVRRTIDDVTKWI